MSKKNVFLLLSVFFIHFNAFAEVTSNQTEMSDPFFVNIIHYFEENKAIWSNWPVVDSVDDWSIVVQRLLDNEGSNISDVEAITRGLTIFFPTGEYNFKNPVHLYLRDAVHPSGNGNRTYNRLGIIGADPGGMTNMRGGTEFKYDAAFESGGSLFIGGMTATKTLIQDYVRGFVINNIVFSNPSKIDQVYGINAYGSSKSRITNCTFINIAYPINFDNIIPGGVPIDESYGEALTIEDIMIVEARKGIQLSCADNSNISKIYMRGSNPDQPFELGISAKITKGCFFSNILINTISDSTGSCFWFDFCSGIKLSGLYFENNIGDIYKFTGSYNSAISIDGSRCTYKYKRLLYAENTVGCELKNHQNLEMLETEKPEGEFDIVLDNAQFSLQNLSGSYINNPTDNMSYYYKIQDDDNLNANFIQNNAHFKSTIPFLKLVSKPDYHATPEVLFSVSPDGSKLKLNTGSSGATELFGNPGNGNFTINNTNTYSEGGNIHLQSGSQDKMVIRKNGNVDVLGNLNVLSANGKGEISSSTNNNLTLNSTAGGIRFQTSNTTKMFIQNNGRVGINWYDIESNPAHLGFELTVGGNIYCSGGLVEGSDSRFKKNVELIENPLEKIKKLNGVTYNWRKDEFPKRNFTDQKQIGMIAQDVEKILPELVQTDPDGYKSLSYNKITAVLIEAIKAQQEKIDELEQIINNVKK